ncbi:DUF4177 domain-containing protein [Metamycoplasma subdolum]|nr:DUF4177 domain-containing protein [Metamycoplasma subdolum]WPB50688.1 DUF4177 domain-containing protein [Metamycoplasma subdolum]
MEQALNAYGKQGWRVATAFSVEVPGFLGGTRKEAICIFERDTD